MPVKFLPTKHTNLVRTESGMYYMRASINGRVVRAKLDTDRENVALLRLSERLNRERTRAAAIATKPGCGQMVECIKTFLDRSQTNPKLKARTREYHRETIALLRRTWPGFDALDVGQVTAEQCRAWATQIQATPTRRGKSISAPRFNGTLDTLRALFAIAIEQHFRYDNPALAVTRMPVQQKKLVLPTAEQFNRLLEYLDKRKTKAGQLVRFLAYSGARLDEANHVLWADVSFERGEIRLHKTKGGAARTVPMIPEMREFLLALRSERPKAREVLEIGTIKNVLKQALQALEMPHITHHDLRHLFATRCIESGVDIPTVARWLGHKDGGALAMRVYGHLRDEHSKAMAQKVRFG